MNEFISIFWNKFIKYYNIEEYTKVFISLDNAPINKNNIIISLLFQMFNIKNKNTIIIIYKCEYHSKCSCDRHFGNIKRNLMKCIGSNREIITVEDMKNYIISMISNTSVTVINKNNTVDRDFKIKLVELIKNIKKIVMLKFKTKKLYCKKRYNEK